MGALESENPIPDLKYAKPDGSLFNRVEMEQQTRAIWTKVHWLRIKANKLYDLAKQVAWGMPEITLRHWILDEMIRRGQVVGNPIGVNVQTFDDDAEKRNFTQQLTAMIQAGQALVPQEGEGFDMTQFQQPPPPPMPPGPGGGPNGSPQQAQPQSGYAAPPQGGYQPPPPPPMGGMPGMMTPPPAPGGYPQGYPPPQQPMQQPQMQPPPQPPQQPQFAPPQPGYPPVPQGGPPMQPPPGQPPQFAPPQGMQQPQYPQQPPAPVPQTPGAVPPGPPTGAPNTGRGRGGRGRGAETQTAGSVPPPPQPAAPVPPMAGYPQPGPNQGFAPLPAPPQVVSQGSSGDIPMLLQKIDQLTQLVMQQGQQIVALTRRVEVGNMVATLSARVFYRREGTADAEGFLRELQITVPQ